MAKEHDSKYPPPHAARLDSPDAPPDEDRLARLVFDAYDGDEAKIGRFIQELVRGVPPKTALASTARESLGGSARKIARFVWEMTGLLRQRAVN